MGWKKVAGKQIFSNLAALIKSLLCIAHSNASSERTFSMVRKIVTKSRTSMHNDTVCAGAPAGGALAPPDFSDVQYFLMFQFAKHV